MSTNESHLLPSPDNTTTSSNTPTNLSVNSETAVKLDALGPMVVNSDGTLSRIANWDGMTEAERERTLRVLSARNKIRIENQKQHEPEGTTT